jgi:hypothetical protein
MKLLAMHWLCNNKLYLEKIGLIYHVITLMKDEGNNLKTMAITLIVKTPLHWVAGKRSIWAKAHLTSEKKLAQVLQFHQLQWLVKQSSSCKGGQTK